MINKCKRKFILLITIDPYYDIQFYNECKEALKNNNVEFKEFISVKQPFDFYLEVENVPTFINYDEIARSRSRYLVNIITPLKPSEDYIYERRESFTNLKAIKRYAINEPLESAQQSGEGIFFTANKDEILRISKEYPRKIWFMGKYFNHKYRVFFTDNLIVKNYINESQILVESKQFKLVTELESELNFKIFREKDRLEKLSVTPYIKNGIFYPVSSVRPVVTDKFLLT